MVISLYITVICFCAYVAMMGHDMEIARAVVLWVGIVFFWIAEICYSNTISNLKDEIKELKENINRIKE